MNKVKLSIFTAIFIVTALTFFSPCEAAGGKSALAGRWDLIGVEGPDKGNPEDMELLNDGTGIIDGAGITYKTESGRFYIAHRSAAAAYDYKLSGSTLTLTNGGVVLKYMKREKPKLASFTDSRNNKTYKTVKMPGGKIWFAENLNYAAEGSKCYNNKEENCQKYGRLYDWATAMKACPKGWHLPSDDELAISMLGGDSTVSDTVSDEWIASVLRSSGKRFKAANGWESYLVGKAYDAYKTERSGNGKDIYGFAALPGGLGASNNGRFDKVGYYGFWWIDIGFFSISYDSDYLFLDDLRSEDPSTMNSGLCSVRCVQD